MYVDEKVKDRSACRRVDGTSRCVRTERFRISLFGRGGASHRQLRSPDRGERFAAKHDAQRGVLGTYRWYFHRNHGAEFNYGYSLNTQKLEFGGTTAGFKTHVNEATAAYVLRFPKKRFVPFALAGAGALVFDLQNGGAV